MATATPPARRARSSSTPRRSASVGPGRRPWRRPERSWSSPKLFQRMAKGSLTVITGPMFSNKSGELIRLATVHRIAGRKVGLFKHSLDDRYEGLERISTHGGQSAEAEPVGSSATIGLLASSYAASARDRAPVLAQ